VEGNRAVTRFAVVLYGVFGLSCALLSIGTRSWMPFLAWLGLPLAGLVVVVIQSTLAYPLMILTALLSGRPAPRNPSRKDRP
jgi:hypothetical protein